MARRASVVAFVLVALAILPPPLGSADAPHYTLEPGVRLAPEMQATIARIADAFHERTRRDIVITSGTRSAREQAEAMFDKLQLGQPLTRLYRDFDSAYAIQAAYRAHRRGGRRAAVDAMVRVIDGQVSRGVFISRHLRASAADVRSRDMTRRQRRVFEEVARATRDVSVLAEGTPPHFHLELSAR